MEVIYFENLSSKDFNDSAIRISIKFYPVMEVFREFEFLVFHIFSFEDHLGRA